MLADNQGKRATSSFVKLRNITKFDENSRQFSSDSPREVPQQKKY